MTEKLSRKLIIDEFHNRGIDVTYRGDRIVHIDYLVPEDWGDYQWELMD